MLYTSLFIPTLRESPKEAEIVSHMLLLRAAYMRQVASGIYAILPLGKKVLQKIIAIISEEMEKIGANDVLFPLAQPAELWISSGRWEIYGKELLRFKDRLARDFVLAPTHEEVCTAIVSNEIQSYKALPLTLYQIHWKFRDELRPRYGLLRGREFLMKDAYSFHSSFEDLDSTYNNMYTAYEAILSRLSLDFVAVDADTGSIGGAASCEFMALADVGEDTIVYCPTCAYAANIEKARSVPSQYAVSLSSSELLLLETPEISSIAELKVFCNVESHEIIKSIAYIADGCYPILACVRGDRAVNEAKIRSYIGADTIALATEEEIENLFESVIGFVGPKDIASNVRCIFDDEVEEDATYIIGANKKNYHFTNFVLQRDMTTYTRVDIRMVEDGDCCYHCSSPLFFRRGIEVGHIFKLGTKYSEAMHAYFLNAEGVAEPFIMGCYGIGVSRLLATVIEQSHDEHGIIFPLAIAPFSCILIALDMSDEIKKMSDALYSILNTFCEVLYDDRKERAGVKLNDADLIGIPLQIILGKKGYANGIVECKVRSTGERFEIPLMDFKMHLIKGLTQHYPEFLQYCSL